MTDLGVTTVLNSGNHSYDTWRKGVDLGGGFWAMYLPEQSAFKLYHGQVCIAVHYDTLMPGEDAEVHWPITVVPE